MAKTKGMLESLVNTLIEKHHSPPAGKDLRRVVEIIRESQEIINDSDNLRTVASRYYLLLSSLEELKNRPKRDLKYYGISSDIPFSDSIAMLNEKKSVIFNQAIDRSYHKAMNRISSLKTMKGRENALSKFYDETCAIIGEYGLPSACFLHLEEIYRKTLPNIQ